jgi:purine-binding chemotaxis protein CheW
MTPDTRSCLRFRLGHRAFGVSLDQVREVAPVDRVHPVPLAPPHVLGLVNLRGQVLTLLHTSALLGVPSRGAVVSAGLALVLAPPRHNLALFVEAHVDLASAGAHGMTMVPVDELAARLEEQVVAAFRTAAAAVPQD